MCPQCGHANPKDSDFCEECGQRLAEEAPTLQPPASPSPEPTSFAEGRYQVKKLLGEGGKKGVYLDHDTRLGRELPLPLSRLRVWMQRPEPGRALLYDQNESDRLPVLTTRLGRAKMWFKPLHLP